MKYIITGGPCVGKTTVLEKLAFKGFETVSESSRIVIDHERKKAETDSLYSPIYPHTNLAKFQLLVLEQQRLSELNIESHSTFLDRSFIDNLAYSALGKLDMNHIFFPFIKNAGYTGVFFLDRLPFYNNDSSRLEDRTSAKIIHSTLLYFYQKSNIPIFRVRFFHGDDGVEKRANFILEKVGLI